MDTDGFISLVKPAIMFPNFLNDFLAGPRGIREKKPSQLRHDAKGGFPWDLDLIGKRVQLYIHHI
jgi:hypothetical protein